MLIFVQKKMLTPLLPPCNALFFHALTRSVSRPGYFQIQVFYEVQDNSQGFPEFPRFHTKLLISTKSIQKHDFLEFPYIPTNLVQIVRFRQFSLHFIRIPTNFIEFT